MEFVWRALTNRLIVVLVVLALFAAGWALYGAIWLIARMVGLVF